MYLYHFLKIRIVSCVSRFNYIYPFLKSDVITNYNYKENSKRYEYETIPFFKYHKCYILLKTKKS